MRSLELENKNQKKTIIKLRQQLYQYKTLDTECRKIFTPGQKKKLINPMKKVLWSEEDISQALQLYAVGPGAYRFLCDKGFPYPGKNEILITYAVAVGYYYITTFYVISAPSTLRQWKQKSTAENVIENGPTIMLEIEQYTNGLENLTSVNNDFFKFP